MTDKLERTPRTTPQKQEPNTKTHTQWKQQQRMNTPPPQKKKKKKKNGPRREKTCLRGSRQSEFQTSLLSYRD